MAVWTWTSSFPQRIWLQEWQNRQRIPRPSTFGISDALLPWQRGHGHPPDDRGDRAAQEEARPRSRQRPLCPGSISILFEFTNWALFRSKVDGFVPHTQHVNLSIGSKEEEARPGSRQRPLRSGYPLRSKVDGFVVQTQHVNLSIVSKEEGDGSRQRPLCSGPPSPLFLLLYYSPA